MIELIFVIVIIGILAAVAIPKMAATRDDAAATTCVHEIGQFLSEATSSYTKVGGTKFNNRVISKITNTPVGVTDGNNGFSSADAALSVSAKNNGKKDGGIAEQVTFKLQGSVFDKTDATKAKSFTL
ncbi:hypothetical protein MNB_SV-9-884 [hydrothermal vent metagenome]|uniref:Type II secretion envelope pseudopilin protein (PulG,guides folded protein to PulD in outer membrane) n=1 Tax=hydrothermal vent metagenome TaxID=652676 RepID=A0A1W1BIT2_9ZZZZ